MTKARKTELCRKILYKYDTNAIIEDAREERFLISIFENHSEWEKKKGSGVKNISIFRNQYNKCFRINRTDGTSTDISFVHSISNRSPLSEIKRACRDAVRPTIIKFRDDNVIYGETLCAISGEVLTIVNTNVDHYDLTFDEMFTNWLKGYTIDFLYSKINDSEDNNVRTYFTDTRIINDFINYHNENTHLRAVTKKVNLSNLKRK